MGDKLSQEGDKVGGSRETQGLKSSCELFSFLPTKKMAKRNLVILVTFLITLGLLRAPLREMGNTTQSLIVFRRFKVNLHFFYARKSTRFCSIQG